MNLFRQSNEALQSELNCYHLFSYQAIRWTFVFNCTILFSLAKGKLSEIKRPKTGGGPKPVSPSASEKAILENLEGRPSLEGLSGGIDTSALSGTSKKQM